MLSIHQLSLKSMILRLFIPIIMLLIFVTGLISYLLASDQLQENTFTNIFDTVSQTESFLNDRLTDLVTSLTLLDNDSDIADVVLRTDNPAYEMQPDDYLIMNKALNRAFFDRGALIDGLLLYYNEGRLSFYREDDLTSKVKVDLEPYKRKQADDSTSTIFWRISTPSGKVSFYKLQGSDVEHSDGMIKFDIKSSFFQSILSNPTISESGYLSLISEDGHISYKEIPAKYDLREEELQSLLMHTTTTSGQITAMNEHGKEVLIIYDTLRINKWKIAAVIPKDELLKKVNYIKYVSLAVMFIMFVIVIFLSNMLAHIITKPIVQLTRKINKIEKGNLDIEFKQISDNEIGVLNRGIRDMISRINDLIVQVEEEQDMKRTAELAALQFQIRPHFLYNTLYSIKQLVEMGEADEASRMVSALADFFRISISKGSEIITISQEIEHIKLYFTIQHIRYGDSFTYEIHIDEDLLDWQIVKMTLQPLVENAIYHGMKQIRTKGHIRIRGYTQDGDGVIRVEDNGAGMSASQLIQIQNGLSDKAGSEVSIGYGIRNVHQRLQLHYGSSYGLNIESIAEEGTTVIVTFRQQHEGE